MGFSTLPFVKRPDYSGAQIPSYAVVKRPGYPCAQYPLTPAAARSR
jgi:hypothetical protein